jgi:hypothetical protein
MKPRTLTLHFLLLIAVAPAWGQSPSPPVAGDGRRPLNLSLPRDVLTKPAAVVSTEADDMTVRNLQKEVEEAEKRSERQPYGTGYEARQRAILSGSGNPGFGGGGFGGGAGAGGAGQGGMGRGR